MPIHVRVASGSELVDGSAEMISVSKSRLAIREAAIGSSPCGRCHRGSTRMAALIERYDCISRRASLLVAGLKDAQEQDRHSEHSVRYFALPLLRCRVV